MPRLLHPISGVPVDVPDNDRTLAAYYLAEGYVTDGPRDLPAELDGHDDDPAEEPGEPTLPASGEQPLSGESLEL